MPGALGQLRGGVGRGDVGVVQSFSGDHDGDILGLQDRAPDVCQMPYKTSS